MLHQPHLALLLVLLLPLWVCLGLLLLDLDLHEDLLLGFANLLLHHQGDAPHRHLFLFLFLPVHLLLQGEHVQAQVLLLLELAFLLPVADVGLEVFELILGGPLALLVVVDGFGDGFDGGVPDGNQHWFFVLAIFLALDSLFLLGDFLFELSDANTILNYFFLVILALLMLLLILETVLGVEEGTSDVGLDRGDLGFWLFLHLFQNTIKQSQTRNTLFQVFSPRRGQTILQQLQLCLIILVIYMDKVGLLFAIVVVVSASYSETLGLKLCKLTVASYCKKSDVETWACNPCRNSILDMKNVKTFENSSMDTLGFIATSTQLQAIVLVFRGTLPWDIKNWISDINFIITSYPLCNNNCKVHRGFYYAFKDIEKQIISAVAQYKKKYGFTNVIVTGHSLGAAIAYHAAAHLIANGTKVTDLYTYGCPRVGDAKFTVWFNEVFGKGNFKARVTHGRDPVPHLPLEDWGFLHINTEVFYKGNLKTGPVICKDESGQDKKCSDQYYADVMVTDHLSYYDLDFAGSILACQA